MSLNSPSRKLGDIYVVAVTDVLKFIILPRLANPSFIEDHKNSGILSVYNLGAAFNFV